MTEKLFVYGIFLDEDRRVLYGMSNPEYATVKNYITVGNTIVQAWEVPHYMQASLTGLLVDVEAISKARYTYRDKKNKVQSKPYDRDNWEKLDHLEYGYERIKVTTTTGVEAWMYVGQ